MSKRRRLLLGLTYAAWLGAWLWIFTFGFSSGFFDYHLGTRIPVLILALVAVAAPPLSGYWTISRVVTGRWGPTKAAAIYLAASAAPLILFWGVLAAWMALAQQAGRLAFEADEAMGHGITFMLSVAVFLAVGLGVSLVLWAVGLWRRWAAGRGEPR